jgi:hypothetical protein
VMWRGVVRFGLYTLDARGVLVNTVRWTRMGRCSKPVPHQFCSEHSLMVEKKQQGGGNAQWTTDEQLAYLKSQSGAYQAAQARPGRKFSDFWVTVFEYWFQHWPLDELTETEKEEGLTKEDQARTVKAVSSPLDL